MTTPQEVVTEARSWLGTRWSHGERTKGVATDCAGLIVGVMKQLTGFDALIPPYSRTPSNYGLLRVCEQHLIRADAPALARVAVMKFQSEPQHIGIFGDYPGGGLSLIHSYAQVRKVVEHRFDDLWASRVLAVFVIPGVVE